MGGYNNIYKVHYRLSLKAYNVVINLPGVYYCNTHVDLINKLKIKNM